MVCERMPTRTKNAYHNTGKLTEDDHATYAIPSSAFIRGSLLVYEPRMFSYDLNSKFELHWVSAAVLSSHTDE